MFVLVAILGNSAVDGKPERTNQWCDVLWLSRGNHWKVKG